MKQRFILFVSTLLFSVFFTVSISAYNVVIDNIYYNLNTEDKTAEVTYKNTKYNSYSGVVTIPSSISRGDVVYTVISIGESAFYGCSDSTSVTIPNTVTSIGIAAFKASSGLTSITIPNSVKSIGVDAFKGCSGLTSVTIPNSVTSIDSETFYDCSGLTSVTIPNSVTSIGSSAFYGCSSLTSITIPNSVTSIGGAAFEGCDGITNTIIVNDMLVKMPLNFSGHYSIPNNIKKIIGGAFSDCSSLTSVTIPNSVTSIGGSTFEGCSSLTSVTIPNSVTSIGGAAFMDCSSLTSVTIPNSVTSIEGYAFWGCRGLASVTIPNSVTSIGRSAFHGCSGLTSVTIPNSVTSIGDDTFYGCSGLTSVTIPNSVTSIGSFAFDGCSGLASVTIPNSVSYIESAAFQGCTGLKTVIIGSSVVNIFSNVFGGCDNIETIYCYPDKAPYLEKSAFTSSTYTNANLYIQDSSYQSYQKSSTWRNFVNYIGIFNSPYKITPLANENSEVYYSTYSNNIYDTELQVGAGKELTVYNVMVNNGQLELYERENSQVACGEGVLVRTNADSINVVKLNGYELKPSSEEETMLKATPVEDMTITAPWGYKLFRLTYNNSVTKAGLGFYLGNSDGSQLSTIIYNAYLQVPTDALGSSVDASKGFKLGYTTGIDSIEFVPGYDAEEPTYNLKGQQVDKSAKGILVKGNKKFYLK